FLDGQFTASVGEEGSGPLQFNTPDCIAFSPITRQVYIADSNNHRIQVLNPDLTFSHSFGSKGSANGRFQSPCDIAIDNQGTSFGTKGSALGQLNEPRGIAIDTATGLVYASEWGNHCVIVFTSDGVFVSKFGSKSDQFNCPYALAFVKDGILYVCDIDNGPLVVF
uniref:SMP-30/Gluconolactonase/LRE-like region domain-containing protein n=1 Tax=Amphimedon queenslandica TaxID=400682 RepID=A0A1X7T0H6_AMPQE